MNDVNYVVGFAIDEETNRILLIEKTKPAWQKGLLNGIGGKIENGELPMEAMVREFREETGIESSEDDWSNNGTIMISNDWIVHVFYSYSLNIDKAKTTTEERVVIHDINDIMLNRNITISNIQTLVSMGLDPDFKSGKLKTALWYGEL